MVSKSLLIKPFHRIQSQSVFKTSTLAELEKRLNPHQIDRKRFGTETSESLELI